MELENFEALEDWQSMGKRILMYNSSNYLFVLGLVVPDMKQMFDPIL